MAAPDLSRTAESVYDALRPFQRDDEAEGYRLAEYLQALALLVDEPADLARDADDGTPGWAGLFNPQAVPARYLRYLAMFPGVELPRAMSEAEQRARISSTDGQRRGTVAAMVEAARANLTGSQTIIVTERHGGSRWRLAFATFAAETPDAAAVVAAIGSQKPAGYKFTHTVIDAATFDVLRDTHTDFNDVTGTFASFDEIRTNPAKQ